MSLVCPRDGAPLDAMRHQGKDYFGCGKCRGLLLPLAMLPELSPWASTIAARAGSWPTSAFPCPHCGKPMRVMHADGVEIDLCPHCDSLWLDQDEIDRIRPAWRDEAREQAKAEAENQAIESASSALDGTLDWLGDALGALLSP
jgi:Zn-finger nucleic acid-binding protein